MNNETLLTTIFKSIKDEGVKHSLFTFGSYNKLGISVLLGRLGSRWGVDVHVSYKWLSSLHAAGGIHGALSKCRCLVGEHIPNLCDVRRFSCGIVQRVGPIEKELVESW